LFRKKRLALIALFIVCGMVAWWKGLAVGATLLAIALGLVLLRYLWFVVAAHRGVQRLEQLRDRYAFDRMAEVARSRCQDDALTFVALGDTRGNVRTGRLIYEAAAAENPAFIVNTGDIIRRGTARELLQRHIPLTEAIAPIPMFVTPGNHERGARRDFAAFKALYGSDRFAFDCGPACFVGFNNSTRARVDDDDLAFLEQALTASAAPRRFVFLHIPPRFFEETFSTNPRRGFTERQDAFRALMARCRVDEVFMAHIHGYATAVFDGVRYTLTAGAGAPLDSAVRDGGHHHYIVVRVRPDGIEREVVRREEGQWIRTPVA